jgi:hypothetical protein
MQDSFCEMLSRKEANVFRLNCDLDSTVVGQMVKGSLAYFFCRHSHKTSLRADSALHQPMAAAKFNGFDFTTEIASAVRRR